MTELHIAFLRNASIIIAAWLLSLLVAVSAAVADPGEVTGRVVAISDGDTLTLLVANNEPIRVRLAAIDAPEKGQPFSNRATRVLADRCMGKDARVVVSDTDRYGRLVGTVYCNGMDVNDHLVHSGVAWVYRHYAPADSPLYQREKEARDSKRGLWVDDAPVPPWLWRRGHRSVESLESDPGVIVWEVRGNLRSGIYHVPGCPGYDGISQANRRVFQTEEAAIASGFRRARNCP